MKKLVCLLLSVLLIVAIAAPVAAAGGRIYRIDTDNFAKHFATNLANGRVLVNGKAVTTQSQLENLTLRGNAEIKIYLTANMFLDADGKPVGTDKEAVTRSQLSNGKITVRATTRKGGSYINSMSITSDNNGAYLRIRLNKVIPAIDDVDFEWTLRFYVNKSRATNADIVLAGTIENPTIYLDSGDDYVNLSDGSIADPDDYIRNIEVELGDGVMMWARMYEGTKYYGVAQITMTEAQESVLSKYPGIDMVYKLYTINLNKSSNRVYFDINNAKSYYVYDAKGTYLGTGDGQFAYSTTYYLSTQKYPSLQV